MRIEGTDLRPETDFLPPKNTLTDTHRYVTDRPNKGVAIADMRCLQPLDAFIDRQQQILRLQRRRRGGGDGAEDAEDDGRPPPPKARGGGSGVLTRDKALRMLRKPALRAPLSRQPQPQPQVQARQQSAATTPAPIDLLAINPPGVFRGLAALPGALLVVPPACVDMEAKIASLTPAQVQDVFEPPGRRLRRLLCPGTVAAEEGEKQQQQPPWQKEKQGAKGQRGGGGGGGGASLAIRAQGHGGWPSGMPSPLSPTFRETLDSLIVEEGELWSGDEVPWSPESGGF